jgi:2'-5' RNA ligase
MAPESTDPDLRDQGNPMKTYGREVQLECRSIGLAAGTAAADSVKVVSVASPHAQSALILEVPEAEPAVQRLRERLDASALLGVPAHITVLAPFIPADAIDAAVLGQLDRLFAAVSRFRFRLDHTGWFSVEVLWLGPQEPAPFRALTHSVHQAFPAFPPFGGRFDEVVPHLTIGYGHPLSDLRAAEEAVQAHLPIEARASRVGLMAQLSPGGRWVKTASFSFT